MADIITSSRFMRLMDNRLRAVGEGEYKDLKSMIPTFFSMLSSKKAWEEFFSVGDIPDIPEFNGYMTTLSVSPGYHTKIEPIEYGAKLLVQRKFIDDKQYSVLDNFAGGLMKAGLRTREKKGVRVFSNAFSSAFDYQTSEEGVALCSDSHTTKSGTSTSSGFDNAGTSALNKTNLAATRLLMKGFRNDISERIEISDNLALVVPANLEETAYEIVKTPKGLDTAEGNVNFQYGMYKVIVYPRLDDSDTNNWFLVDLDRMKRDLMWVDRIKPEITSNWDFNTKMFMISIYFRMAYGWKGWRWIYGHQVS